MRAKYPIKNMQLSKKSKRNFKQLYRSNRSNFMLDENTRKIPIVLLKEVRIFITAIKVPIAG